MTSFLEMESSASRLRRSLHNEQIPAELRLLLGLAFFEKHQSAELRMLEPYVREFLPLMAGFAGDSHPQEFLPEEVGRLAAMVALLKVQPTAIVEPADIEPFTRLGALVESTYASIAAPLDTQERPDHASAVNVNCLFVEDYPELEPDLAPRGRILTLMVSALPLTGKKRGEDDVVVKNPVEKPDDRFLAQARDSVQAARQHLLDHCGLSLKKHYQFTFEVNSTVARFTGDSLGVAFAVGAIVAIEKVELFRERLSVSPQASFTGALSVGGELSQIKGEGLKCKITRAFYSHLKLLVIPRAQISEAWQFLNELETALPGRKLELVGADDLGSVANDPRLIRRERRPLFLYTLQKALRKRRTAWVELPVLVVLVAILVFLLMFFLDRTPANIDCTAGGFEVENRFGWTLWRRSFDDLFSKPGELDSTGCAIADIDGDGQPEVLYMPRTAGVTPQSGWLFVYSASGDSLDAWDCSIRGEYPTDTVPYGVPNWYEVPWLDVIKVGGETRIVTTVARTGPSRGYVSLWSPSGKRLGWYINSGATSLRFAKDYTGDGREELIFFGFQLRLKGMTMYVLPPDSFSGVSPPYWNRAAEGDYDLSAVKRGNQTAYLVFLPTKVGTYDLPADYQPFAEVIESSTGELTLRSVETSNHGLAIYEIDRRFRARSLWFGDNLVKRIRTLMARDSLPEMPLDVYADTVRNRVMCWTDSGWVTEGQLRAAGQ